MKPSDRDRDLQREIELHLALEAEEQAAGGRPADDARRAALRAFGNVARTREDARAVWFATWLQDALQDLRYAARVFARNPAFTVGATLILTLGIGASTAIFGAINGVILASLPYQSADRLAQLWLTNPARNIDRFSVSLPLYRDWRDQTRSWTDLAAFKNGSVTIQTAGEPERVPAQFMTANTLPLLGMPIAIGRSFLPEEDVPNGPDVAMLSRGLWQRAYGGDPGTVGQSITIDGTAHTIVGVADSTTDESGAQVLLPLAGHTEDRRNFSELDVIGRLRPEVTIAEAGAEITALTTRLEARNPDGVGGWGVRVQRLADVVVGSQLRQRLYVLFAAVSAVLLIACANLSGLLLVRASARTREMSIRAAIGGGRSRIVRQLVTESLLLAACGGVGGIVLAYALMHVFRTSAMAHVPRASQIGLDPLVVLFACGVTAVSGLLAGLAPARQLSRLDIQRGLHERTPAAAVGARRSRHVLVIAQLALSVVLLAAAGLMLRTLDHLNGVDLGFAPERILTAQVAPRTAPEAFFTTLVERVRQLPGVVSVGATSGAPMTSGNTSLHVYPVGPALMAPTESVQADWRTITGEYFAAMQTPILAGRDFERDDDSNAPKVVMVNQNLARALWGDDNPLGRQVDLGGGGGEPATVIGLVRDVRSHDPAETAQPTYYVSAYRNVWGPMTLVIRTTTDADALLPLVRAEVRALDPALPVFAVSTMRDLVSARLAPQRLVASLLGVFAVLALVLAVTGVYGVMAYATRQRTNEVGIRIALGAQPRNILAMLLREGVVLVAAGSALGLLLTWPVTGLMRALLSGVSPADPLTFSAAGVGLVTEGLIACYLPARRAARINPISALRGE